MRFSLLLILSLGFSKAWSQGKYANISIDGTYLKKLSEYTVKEKYTIGGELGVPVNEYLEISLGHQYVVDKDVYTDAYKTMLKNYYLEKYGVEVPLENEELMKEYRYTITSLNGGMGVMIGYVKPSLFGGAVWQTVCESDSYQESECTTEDVSWNVGVSLAVVVTRSLRLRSSYRLMPSLRDDKETYDGQMTVGLTWGL